MEERMILSYCKDADKISIIGPTAGFIPDPLFKRGLNVLGGDFVSQTPLFIKIITQDKRGGPPMKIYRIQANQYLGFETLLKEM